MDDIIGEVLRAEKACAAEIESAQCRCRERLACRRQALERELGAERARLEQEHALKLAAELDACRAACAAALADIRARHARLYADAALCAAVQNCILDIILGP